MIAIDVTEGRTAYGVGDVPASAVVVALEATLDAETDTTTVVVLDPAGESVTGWAAVIDDGVISLTYSGEGSPFPDAGVYEARLTVTGQTCEPLHLIAEDPANGWLSLEAARLRWPDAPEDEWSLYELLTSARAACEAFAPVLAEDEPVPPTYRQAQVMQARAVWNSSRATNDRLGDSEYGVTVYPLDWNVKQLLRPKGIPVLA